MRSGYIAIVGRPNVGKSTLLNRILQQKISITSSKPQTTRHRVLGIKTSVEAQAIYVDTPGLHKAEKKAMNRIMNRTAVKTLNEVDVVLMVVDSIIWIEEDELVYLRTKQANASVILVINKIDKIKDKERLLPILQQKSDLNFFKQIVPVSAKSGKQVEQLEREILKFLPEGIAYYPEDQITDRSSRFLVAEIVREKLMRQMGQEIPYSTTVEIEQFEEEEKLNRIAAIIWVERDSQKNMVIGKQGLRLKEIGKQARVDIEKLLHTKVYLQLWVKVKEGWSDNERSLQSLGYGDGAKSEFGDK